MKIYSKVDTLPYGEASDKTIPGCIVLEGGAFRGVYTSGVLDALMEEDVNLYCTLGVSAGAMCGMNYVSGQIGRAGRINLTYRHCSRYVGFRALLENRGVIGFKFVFPVSNDSGIDPFDETRFLSDDRRFVAAATNCRDGSQMFFEKSNCTDMFKAVQASASMPYVSAKVKVDGVPCLDGGCADKIPYEWAFDEGDEKVVVVRTRHKDFRYDVKDKKSRAPYLFYGHGRDKTFADEIATSESRYNEKCDKLIRDHENGKIFMISPSSPVSVSRLEKDMEKLGDWYWLGYNDTMDCMPALKKYLGIDE